eukprot:CAMPEP_0197525894 /NCGR_PEP_ID=MMETSP1318-20131121/15068_1 /TAXON_ID=552666 /ORGANISM="Partenskyella glossopodia, Strain RCC365" /LENGTH=155 /DNA_ID=CAMNT_0043079725 /DNA_START=12 /DNA_END=479 /DNA_ORIENTATION=+
MSLEGLRAVTVRAHSLGRFSGNAVDFHRRIETKFSKESNPDCKIDFVDVSMNGEQIDYKSEVEVQYEHGKSEVFPCWEGDVAQLIQKISEAKNPAYFEPVNVEEDDAWEEDAERYLAQYHEKMTAKRKNKREKIRKRPQDSEIHVPLEKPQPLRS